eukprot:8942131-Heterocapsa_arctica.AAC.1
MLAAELLRVGLARAAGLVDLREVGRGQPLLIADRQGPVLQRDVLVVLELAQEGRIIVLRGRLEALHDAGD